MGQSYICSRCWATSKALDEHPITGHSTVHTGCPNCATATTHVAEGRAEHHLRARQQEARSR